MKHKLATPLIILFSLLLAGCNCVNRHGELECPLASLVAGLTLLAYGDFHLTEAPRGNSCPTRLVCIWPDCVRVQENGSFEGGGEIQAWYGDATSISIFACDGYYGRQFEATTPEGPSPSRSSQLFQVFDYHALVPAGAAARMRRVRAHANFFMFLPRLDDNRQFGLRIDAYAGDPSSFPRAGDPETFAAETDGYRRLQTAQDSILYDPDGPEWQPLRTLLDLPGETDFFVVLLEAYEDRINEEVLPEFDFHYVDDVQVVMDVGNTPPVARPIRSFTLKNSPVDIPASSYAFDATSRVDPASVAVVRPPGSGTAIPSSSGIITYTPASAFVGTDTFTYTVADEEGSVSEEGEVTVIVRDVNEAPVAVDDLYDVPEAGLLIVPVGLGVLANDSDPEGDTLTAVLVRDVGNGSLALDATGAFVYTAGQDFSGSDTFTYRAFDGLLESNEATVTLRGATSNTPPIARDDTVTTSGGFPITIDVLQNDSDPDGDRLSIARVGEPGNGTATVLLGLRISYTPDPPFRGTDSFTYVAQDEHGAESNEATVTVVVQPRYFLSIVTQASSETFTTGQENLVFFNVLVGNGGGDQAQGVEAVNRLPAGFTYISHQVSTGTFDPDGGVWQIGPLSPGPFATLRIYARAPDQAGTYTFDAELTGGLEFDADPGNNAHSVTVEVVEPEEGSE